MSVISLSSDDNEDCNSVTFNENEKQIEDTVEVFVNENHCENNGTIVGPIVSNGFVLANSPNEVSLCEEKDPLANTENSFYLSGNNYDNVFDQSKISLLDSSLIKEGLFNTDSQRDCDIFISGIQQPEHLVSKTFKPCQNTTPAISKSLQKDEQLQHIAERLATILNSKRKHQLTSSSFMLSEENTLLKKDVLETPTIRIAETCLQNESIEEQNIIDTNKRNVYPESKNSIKNSSRHSKSNILKVKKNHERKDTAEITRFTPEYTFMECKSKKHKFVLDNTESSIAIKKNTFSSSATSKTLVDIHHSSASYKSKSNGRKQKQKRRVGGGKSSDRIGNKNISPVAAGKCKKNNNGSQFQNISKEHKSKKNSIISKINVLPVGRRRKPVRKKSWRKTSNKNRTSCVSPISGTKDNRHSADILLVDGHNNNNTEPFASKIKTNDNAMSPSKDNVDHFNNKLKFIFDKVSGDISVSIISPTQQRSQQMGQNESGTNTLFSKSNKEEGADPQSDSKNSPGDLRIVNAVKLSTPGLLDTKNNVGQDEEYIDTKAPSTTFDECNFDPTVISIEHITNISSSDIAILKSEFCISYTKIFDESSEKKCVEMGDFLLLAMKEARNYKLRVSASEKFTCKKLQLKEMKMAKLSYENHVKQYSRVFEPLFVDFYKKISSTITCTSQQKNLIIALFLKIFLRVASLSPEFSECLLDAKQYVVTLISKKVYYFPSVFIVFSSNELGFEKDCCLILEFMKDLEMSTTTPGGKEDGDKNCIQQTAALKIISDITSTSDETSKQSVSTMLDSSSVNVGTSIPFTNNETRESKNVHLKTNSKCNKILNNHDNYKCALALPILSENLPHQGVVSVNESQVSLSSNTEKSADNKCIRSQTLLDLIQKQNNDEIRQLGLTVNVKRKLPCDTYSENKVLKSNTIISSESSNFNSGVEHSSVSSVPNRLHSVIIENSQRQYIQPKTLTEQANLYYSTEKVSGASINANSYEGQRTSRPMANYAPHSNWNTNSSQCLRYNIPAMYRPRSPYTRTCCQPQPAYSHPEYPSAQLYPPTPPYPHPSNMLRGSQQNNTQRNQQQMSTVNNKHIILGSRHVYTDNYHQEPQSNHKTTSRARQTNQSDLYPSHDLINSVNNATFMQS